MTGDLDEALSLCRCGTVPKRLTDAEIESPNGFPGGPTPKEENFSPRGDRRVREMLPADGILTFDVGAPHIRSPANGKTTHRKRFTLLMVGLRWGSACCHTRQTCATGLPVVCVWATDASSDLGEMATAKRLGICLPVVVLDDRWLGLIRKQERRQLPIQRVPRCSSGSIATRLRITSAYRGRGPEHGTLWPNSAHSGRMVNGDRSYRRANHYSEPCLIDIKDIQANCAICQRD